MVAANRVIISPEDADYSFEFDFDAPPHIVWDWVMDIQRRSQAMGDNGHWSAIARQNGRNGIGAKNHCAHGKGATEEVVVDWRPFEYATCHSVDGGSEYRSMYIFTPLDNGHRTHVEMRTKLFRLKPLWLARIMVRMMFAREKPYLTWFESIKHLMGTNS